MRVSSRVLQWQLEGDRKNPRGRILLEVRLGIGFKNPRNYDKLVSTQLEPRGLDELVDDITMRAENSFVDLLSK